MDSELCHFKVTYLGGYQAPTSELLRRLFGLDLKVIRRERSADRPDISYYEDSLEELDIEVTPERSVDHTVKKVVRCWCDIEQVCRLSLQRELPNWWLSQICHHKRIDLEHKDLSILSFSLGSFLGLNTFVEHYSSLRAGAKGRFKITQCSAHFANYRRCLLVYFVDVKEPLKKRDRDGSTHARHRFYVDYSTLCRVVVSHQADGSVIVYLHLVCSPLLYKSHRLQEHDDISSKSERKLAYVPQSEVGPESKWRRVVEFGQDDTECTRSTLGGCRVLALTFSHKCDWYLDALQSLVALCPSIHLCWGAIQKVAAVPRVPLPPMRYMPFGVRYALFAVWTSSFQVPDEISQRNTAQELNRLLRRLLDEDPMALEEALLTVLQSLDQARIVNFQKGLEQLFNSFREVRARGALTGGVLGQDLPQHVVLVRRAVLTPTKLVLLAPQPVCTSRMLLHFEAEHALRVTMREDDGRMLSLSLGVNREDLLLDNIKPRLLEGFSVGGRRYEFLASSSSQLRNHGAWFYSRDSQGRKADDIRAAIGDLSHIRSPSKYMARLGLAFSQSIGYITVPKECTEVQPDILKEGRNSKLQYNFSDGVGRISSSILKRVHEALPQEGQPCAIQIRYGGCKGMLALDPTLEGNKIIFRDSMAKFQSESKDLFILKTSRPRIVKLNRPMITILCQKKTSGNLVEIPNSVFLDLQKACLEPYLDSLFDDRVAAELLHAHCALRLPFRELADAGLDLHAEPFFRNLLWALHQFCLKMLKEKANIPIPPEFGRTMFGVMDETGTLEYGQVFVQYSTDLHNFRACDESKILKGPVVVTKNPCVHPGDIRRLEAVDVPQLHHLRDCIVFPSIGHRPHPDEMAGSDLDGDEYSVIWYKPLLFKRNDKPMDFFSSEAVVENEPVQVEHMVDFMCKFVCNDKVGILARAHMAWADQLDRGVNSPMCITLARKCSQCVDFVKTGTSAYLGFSEKPKAYPDFMDKHDEKFTYPSRRVLGELYRHVTGMVSESMGPTSGAKPDPRLLLPGREKHLEDARKALRNYQLRVQSLLTSYGIGSEVEALSGAVLAMHKNIKGKHDPTDVAVVLENQVDYLMECTRQEFYRGMDMNADFRDVKPRASAWYEVGYLEAGGARGFAWALDKVLLTMLKESTILGEPHNRGTVRDRLAILLTPREDQQAPLQTVLFNNALKVLRQWVEKNVNKLGGSEDWMTSYVPIVKASLQKTLSKLEKQYGERRLSCQPSVLLVCCLKDLSSLSVTKPDRNNKNELKLGELAMTTLGRLFYKCSGKLFEPVQSTGPVCTQLVLLSLQDDDEFYGEVMRNENIFTELLCHCSEAEAVRLGHHKDLCDEWYLQLLVTGTMWAINRLKSFVIRDNFRKLCLTYIKRNPNRLVCD